MRDEQEAWVAGPARAEDYLRPGVGGRVSSLRARAGAFGLLAVGWLAQAVTGQHESYPALYPIRLAGFVIIIGIVDKNRAARRGK